MARPAGIDVSRWQGLIDWLAVKSAGVAFASIRATIGDTYTDDRFASVVGEAGDLPHVLDVELTGEQPDRVIRERTLACLQEIEGRFGRKPLVYTADWF